MATPEGYTELRIDIPTELAMQIDAVVQASKFKARAEFVMPLLVAGVNYEIHKATVLLRCCRINPLLPEPNRNPQS